MAKIRISPVVVTGSVLTALCLGSFVWDPPLVRAISNYMYDGFLRSVHDPPKSGRIVIVDLDEESLRLHGQWPWPRYLVADMTRRLVDAGASVVAFDIVFAEKDRTSPDAVRQALRSRFQLDVNFAGLPAGFEDYDSLLADCLRQTNVILGCSMSPCDDPVPQIDATVDPEFKSVCMGRSPPGITNTVLPFLPQAAGLTIAIPELRRAARSAFFNAVMDSDSLVRRNPLVWAYGPNIYTSLALEAVRMDRQIRQCIIEYDDQGVECIRLNDLSIPTDRNGRLVVNYRAIRHTPAGLVASFPTFSACRILDGSVGPENLRDKIVFIGTSAVGLKDIRATPLTQHYSGVEIHACMADNILAGDVLIQPTWMVGVNAVAVLLMGVFLTVFLDRGRSWLSALVSAGMVVGALALGTVLMARAQLVFIPAWPILSVLVIYLVLTTIKFWQEERQKKRIRNMFGTMVSQDVLHYLENNPGSFSLTGEKAEATMLFSDVAGFTTISESLTPAQLSDLLNRYLSPMTQIIMDRHGYVDKYEGDLIMAEWGVPFAMQDHAVQACLAALEQQERLKELRSQLQEQFGHALHVRMGINSGTVTAGNMGSDRRFQYTVMGDAVNLASRLEPANKDYGTSIIIGESTRAAVKDMVETRLLDRMVVRGKSLPVAIFELLGRKNGIPATQAELVRLYEEALRLHWERRWDEALAVLDRALALDANDKPSAMIRERVVWYVDNPPPAAWSGAYERTSKD